MKSNSFEKFYYQRIAIGEACGCAEQVINIRDMDARAGRARREKPGSGVFARIVRFPVTVLRRGRS